ncbi:MAG: AsmA family protein, partial [Hyphomicrobiaceae bacterium]
MNNFLAALGALLVVVLGAMFAVPHFVDWNQYRGVIEEETSRVLGRDFRIGGDMRLRLLPTPSFRIEQVRIADPQSASGLPLFKADTVSARLAISPLLRGALEATEIELMKPVVRLVLDQRGGGTWQS